MTSTSPPPPPAPTAGPRLATGLLLADDALTVTQVRLGARGRPVVTAWDRLALDEGVVVGGLVHHGGRLPARIAAALRPRVGDGGARVVLATADAACVPLAAGRAEPVSVLAARLGGGPHGDAVVADAVSVHGRPLGLAGARRSTVQRTRHALADAGVAVAAVEPLPVSLLAFALVALDPPDAAWTARLDLSWASFAVTVGRGMRLEGGAVTGRPGATGLSLHAVGDAPTPTAPAELVRRLLGRSGRSLDDAALAALAVAIGAAVNGLGGAIDAPDLAAAVVVRPFGQPEPLPAWAVEAVPPTAPAIDGSRRARRRSAR